VYREDPASASFLDRFLANLEGINTGIEDRMSAAHALFDPRTAPPETLDWLLRWFDFAADPTWSAERRRLFLRHAMDFFALRGTVAGIRLALRLALDPCDDEGLFGPESARRQTSRIVERFQTRRTAAVALGDPTELTGPRVLTEASRWDPAQGGEALEARWRAAIGDPDALFPAYEDSERWRSFLRAQLGVEPARRSTADEALWTQFLRSRYGRPAALDDAYGHIGGERGKGFEDHPFPKTLPRDGAALRDWYQFVAVVLPANRAAHRFTVLLPMPAADTEGRSPEERRAIAQRVVELQKPAHTTFDLKFFWAAFRLGEVRLGEDTLLDRGGRDPRLRQLTVLGSEHAGETYLGGGPPPAPDHVGRDPLTP
jgi:phage tail-like protein